MQKVYEEALTMTRAADGGATPAAPVTSEPSPAATSASSATLFRTAGR
jgi:hypothetical protein